MLDLRWRLLLGFGALTGLIAVLGAGAWALERSLWAETERLYQRNVVAGAELTRATEALWQLRLSATQALWLGPDDREALVAGDPAWRRQLEQAIEAFSKTPLTLEEQEALAHWREVSTSYLAVRPRLFELLAKQRTGEAQAWRVERATPLGIASVEALGRLVKIQQDAGAASLAGARRMAQQGTAGLVVATLLSLALALTLAHRVSRSVTAPLATLTRLADGLAAGRVPAHPTALVRRDEIGRLGTLLDRVASGLRSIVARAQGAARQLDATALDVVEASRQLSEGASRQARRLEDATAENRSIATALNELATTFDAVARRTSEYAAAAEAGAQQVTTTGAGLEAIRGASHTTQQLLRSALRSSERIGSIVETIQDIGAATHVLSLNASIEASRAGEAGRGFAVVAAEVRGLADRALGSAREIRDIVQGLDTHLRAVQAAASESVAAAEGGVHAGQQVARTFQGLQTSSRDTSASVSRMNDVLADQVQAIRRTAALVGDVGELAQAQQQAASAVHAQGEALRAVVQSLDQVLGQFELEPAPAAAQASRSRTPA